MKLSEIIDKHKEFCGKVLRRVIAQLAKDKVWDATSSKLLGQNQIKTLGLSIKTNLSSQSYISTNGQSKVQSCFSDFASFNENNLVGDG